VPHCCIIVPEIECGTLAERGKGAPKLLLKKQTHADTYKLQKDNCFFNKSFAWQAPFRKQCIQNGGILTAPGMATLAGNQYDVFAPNCK
jgi:hypothetical protein